MRYRIWLTQTLSSYSAAYARSFIPEQVVNLQVFCITTEAIILICNTYSRMGMLYAENTIVTSIHCFYCYNITVKLGIIITFDQNVLC